MKKAAIIFVILIFFMGAGFKVHYLLQPVEPEANEQVVVRVNPGSSTRQIGEQLAEKELIHSSILFTVLTNIRGVEQDLQAGNYEFIPSQSISEIIDDITSGNVATFQVTIPEGFTVEEVINRLADITDYSREELLSVARNWEPETRYIEIPENGYDYALEGLLYPETYNIPDDFTPESVFQVMVRELEKQWGERLKKGSDQYSPFELLIIASMVEKEGLLPDEKPLISGVIHNRLEENMYLQIDATIQYALEQRQQVLFYSDLGIDSVYNTYSYRGLPPGPIANPGDNSIQAALEPVDTDYFFYFARDDGSHIFTETYEQHRTQLEEYRGR